MAGGKLMLVASGSKKPLAMKKKDGVSVKLVRQPRLKRNRGYDGNVKVTFNTLNEVVSNATIDQPFQLSFKLTDCIGAATWLAKYDSYRIDKVEVKWIPILTTVINRPYDDTTTPGTVARVPRIAYAIDRDGDDTTITLGAILARPNHKAVNMTKATSISFTPTRLIPVYRPTTNAYKQDTATKQFIDAGYADTPHYSIVGVIESSAPAQVYQYRREIKYWITFAQRKS